MISIQQTNNSLEMVRSGTITHAVKCGKLTDLELQALGKLIKAAYAEGRKVEARECKGEKSDF